MLIRFSLFLINKKIDFSRNDMCPTAQSHARPSKRTQPRAPEPEKRTRPWDHDRWPHDLQGKPGKAAQHNTSARVASDRKEGKNDRRGRIDEQALILIWSVRLAAGIHQACVRGARCMRRRSCARQKWPAADKEKRETGRRSWLRRRLIRKVLWWSAACLRLLHPYRPADRHMHALLFRLLCMPHARACVPPVVHAYSACVRCAYIYVHAS
jgi:hypothetical protein